MKRWLTQIKQYLQSKNKFILQNPATFEEKFALSISKRNTILASILLLLIFSALIFAVISFTSLKKYVPGFPKNSTELYKIDQKNQLILNEIESKTANYTLWVQNLKSILSDEDTITIADLNNQLENDSSFNYKSIVFERNILDSLLRKKNKSINSNPKNDLLLSILKDGNNFELPSKGKISKSQNNGIHEASFFISKKPVITNAMEGRVIMISNEMMVLQHRYNVVSIYKNLTNIKPIVGEEIPSGKKIGEIADSVFQFQVWYNGSSVPVEVYEDL